MESASVELQKARVELHQADRNNPEKGEPPGLHEPFGEDKDDEISKETNTDKPPDSSVGGTLRRLSRKLTRPDSLDVESMRVRGLDYRPQAISTAMYIRLAYQSIGVVYGDLGTSPLYVFSSTFVNGIKDTNDILGALSLILYTVTLVPLIKYVFIVLQANDNGEGGTFALYSLICRHAKVSLAHSQVPTDLNISSYKLEKPTRRFARATRIKEKLEKSEFLQNVLIVTVLCGTCLVIGDGTLTPAISVLSAIEGIVVAFPATIHQNIAVIITIIILVGIFSLQRFGTNKVSFLFAPAVLVWFLSIGLIGLYNIVKWDPTVFKALNPWYIISYFKRNGKQAWISLGGIVLCITGTEAMFADLGHFNVKSIQIAFTTLVFPSLLCAYIGQASYLMKNRENVGNTFYKSLPTRVYWPMFAVSTLAAIIASQAMISATYSMVRNAMRLGCFPRVTVRHTSKKIHGQIYIPEINWTIMCLSIGIVAGFRDTTQIGNAYGIAVVGVFFISTCLLTLIMIMVWQKSIILSLAFLFIWGTVEGVYFSSVLSKVDKGGWVPLVIAFCFLTIMYSWHYGSRLKYSFELSHKLSLEWLLGLGSSLGMVRVPGIGLLYTELPQGVPAIFAHFITNLPAIHSTLVFVCIRQLPLSSVPEDERILIRRVGPREYRMYRCAVRYGYTDHMGENTDDTFGNLLMASLKNFIRTEAAENTPAPVEVISSAPAKEFNSLSPSHVKSPEDKSSNGDSAVSTANATDPEKLGVLTNNRNGSVDCDPDIDDELMFLLKAKEAGVVYMLGHTDLHCKKNAWFLKRFLINYVYAFLRRNCRTNTLYLSIPSAKLLKVGMTYYI